MRPFEILILATLLLSLFGHSIPPIKRSRWIDFTPSLAVLLVLIHLVLEKFRLQMLPAYVLALLLFLLSIPKIIQAGQQPDKRPPRRFLGIIGFLFKLLIFVFVAALPILLPVFRLPGPTGPHPVGTTSLYLVDDTRPETFTTDPGDHRELMVRVWYPARVEPGASLAPLMERMPIQFSHLSLVQTHAYQDAQVLDAQVSYPVLIFSHGHIGFAEQNLTQMEELASHGYIVCSIAHTYYTIATAFPDGRVVLADPILANAFLEGNSPGQNVYARDLRIWTDDTRFLINELERIQAGERESILVGKLDMARLGIFGQSFGGVAAVQVCYVDGRCMAGVSLDAGLPGAYAGQAMASPLNMPFMFIFNEGLAYNMRPALDSVENTAYGIIVHGSMHFDFTDIGLYSPVLKFTKVFGPIDKHRMVKIINDYTLAFFDTYLKDGMAPLLDGPSLDYPEVTIEIRKAIE